MKKIAIVLVLLTFGVTLSACKKQQSEEYLEVKGALIETERVERKVIEEEKTDSLKVEGNDTELDITSDDYGIYYTEITHEDGIIEAMVVNETDYIVEFDSNIIIEKSEGGEWIDLEYFKGMELPDYKLRIQPHSQDSAGFMIQAYRLEAGVYRISREFSSLNGDKWRGTVYFTKVADFDYTEMGSLMEQIKD